MVIILFFNKNFKAMKKKILVLLSVLTPVLLVLFFSLQPVKEAKANVKLIYRFEVQVMQDPDGQEWTQCRCGPAKGNDCDKIIDWFFCGG